MTKSLPIKAQLPPLLCAYWYNHKDIHACLQRLFFLPDCKDIAANTETQYRKSTMENDDVLRDRREIFKVQALVSPLQCVYMCTEAITACDKWRLFFTSFSKGSAKTSKKARVGSSPKQLSILCQLNPFFAPEFLLSSKPHPTPLGIHLFL